MLHEEQLGEDLNGQGFSFESNFLDAEYCTRIAQAVTGEYNRLVNAGWAFSAGGRYAGHLNFRTGRYGPEIFEILQQKGLVAAAEEIVGSRLGIFHISGNMNLPGSIAQDIHQDFAPPAESIIFNVALVRATAENGATEIVPGSHGDRFTYRTLHTSGAIRRARPLGSEPGDLVIRRGTAWHRGMPNRTAVPRPMLCFCMVPTDKTEPVVAREEPIEFYANRFYGKYARARELAEIYLSPAFHLYRMARS